MRGRSPGGAATAALACALAAVAPVAARGQVSFAAPSTAPGGTVLGRVCLDLDGDGACGPREPGVAGARLLGEGGAVARADAGGRFHLLEVPGRIVASDRSAYGGHVLAVEGLGVRRAFELPPGGAAPVDLPIPPPPPARSPPVRPAGLPAGSGAPLARDGQGRLRWALAGRTAPGARVAAEGAAAVAGPDGVFVLEVALAPGENRLSLAVSTGEAVALFRWAVHLVPRPRGGTLVVPGTPEPLGALAVAPGRGGGALVAGDLPAGLALRAGGLVAGTGRVAAWVPPGASVELVDRAGGWEVGRAPAAGGATLATLAEVEVSVLGKPGILVTARGAGAAKGQAGPVSWEAGLDLDDRDRKESLATLARPRDAGVLEHALDPSRAFPAVGDEAAADDRNAPRGRAWARVEADGARLSAGSARVSLGARELGRYDRGIFGASAEARGDLGPVRVEAGAFGATLRRDAAGNAPPSPAHDVLRATGGAALWLSHGEVVPGSESIRIERRDPLTGRLLSSRDLVRSVDYEIEWGTGRVVLAAPVASVTPPAAALTADPFTAPAATVVVDYLHAAGVGLAAEDLRGGRAGVSLGPVALSARAAAEERGGADAWELSAATAQLDLGPALRLRADAARTTGQLFSRAATGGFRRSDDGGLRFAAPAVSGGSADALHLEASGGAGPVRGEAWWRTRERGFSDGEFLEAVTARERGAGVVAGAEGRRGVSGVARIADRRGADPRDPAGLVALEERQLLARGAWQGERLGLAVEGVHLERDAVSAAGDATAAGVRASWRLDPGLTVDVGHHQALSVTGALPDPTFSAAGATWTRGASSLGLRGGWGPDLGPRLLVSGARLAPGEAVYGTFGADPDAPDVLGGAASALGVRQRTGRAELFTEEQYGRDLFGLRQARVVGATLAPLAGLSLSLSGERGERLRLDGAVVRRQAAAAAAGLVRGPLRLAARGEVRDEGGDDHAAAGGSVEWLVGPGASIAARLSWMRGRSAGLEGLGLDAALGGAWRTERLALLASLGRFVEQRPGLARRDGVAVRLAGTASAAARVKVGAGAGVALQEVAGARDHRLSGSARVQVRVAGPLDAAAEYARRAALSDSPVGPQEAVRAEAGLVSGQARVALGYNLVGFGGDGLTPATDTGRLYLRAQVSY